MVLIGIIGIFILLMISIPSAFSQGQGSELQDYSVDPLGISFKYPSNSEVTYDSTIKNNCESSCLIALKIMDTSNATLSFYASNCNCVNLLTQVKHRYVTTLEPYNISLIADNQTQLKDGTKAWQMEYTTGDRIRYILWFIHDGIFYELNYQNNKDSFYKDMIITKAIINSIEFLPKNSKIEVKDDSIKRTNIIQPPSFINPEVKQSSFISGNISSNPTSETVRNMTANDKDLKSEIFAAVIEYYPAVTLEFISNSTIALKGDEEFMLKTEGSLNSFWTAIDKVKQFGYNLDETTGSGMGSELNPTRFYAVMSNSSLEKKLS